MLEFKVEETRLTGIPFSLRNRVSELIFQAVGFYAEQLRPHQRVWKEILTLKKSKGK